MRRLVVLGAGTAGTMAVTKLRRRLPARDWSITVVDQDDLHLYQPGLLLLPFGVYTPNDLVKPRRRFVPSGVDLIVAEIERVDAAANEVHLAGGRTLGYDYLVVATGSAPVTPVVRGRPVAFVRTTAEGVPRAGATSVLFSSVSVVSRPTTV